MEGGRAAAGAEGNDLSFDRYLQAGAKDGAPRCWRFEEMHRV